MRFTTFHNPQSDDPAQDGLRIQQALDTCLAAERLGYDIIWLAEHHFLGYTVFEDAIVFAAALSGHVKRASIGFALLTFPLYHPVRLASQLALLDHLLQGRLLVGASPGYLKAEYEGYGVDPYQRRELLEETLDLVKRAWTEAPFEYEFQGVKGKAAMVRPRPFQQPIPEIIHASTSLDSPSMRQAAKAGCRLIYGRYTLDRIRDENRKFREMLEEENQPADVIERCMKLSEFQRHVYVADSDEQALEDIAKPIEWLLSREREVNDPNSVQQNRTLFTFDLEGFTSVASSPVPQRRLPNESPS